MSVFRTRPLGGGRRARRPGAPVRPRRGASRLPGESARVIPRGVTRQYAGPDRAGHLSPPYLADVLDLGQARPARAPGSWSRPGGRIRGFGAFPTRGRLGSRGFGWPARLGRRARQLAVHPDARAGHGRRRRAPARRACEPPRPGFPGAPVLRVPHGQLHDRRHHRPIRAARLPPGGPSSTFEHGRPPSAGFGAAPIMSIALPAARLAAGARPRARYFPLSGGF